jgi:hypothetical protein
MEQGTPLALHDVCVRKPKTRTTKLKYVVSRSGPFHPIDCPHIPAAEAPAEGHNSTARNLAVRKTVWAPMPHVNDKSLEAEELLIKGNVV